MNQLEWNAYEGWDRNEVQEYNVYRKVDGVPNPTGPLATVDGLTTSYIDDVSNLSNVEGSFSYFVEAVENDGFNGFEDFKDQSRSNEIIIEQETKVIIPNAFTPGLPPDDVFKPLVAFIDLEGYQLSIFNKWGQMIFQTTDPTRGWDGRYNGEFVPTDAYVYLIVYRTPEGQTIEERGTVTALR
jgi:gliding motility-associated-like protein